MKINAKKRKVSPSFTLLETLIALTILSFAITGPMELASRAIQSVGVSQNQIVSSYLAQEAIEFVKNVRDTNFIQGKNWLAGLDQCLAVNGCYVDIPTYFSSGLPSAISSCGSQCPAIKYDDTSGFYYNYNIGDDTAFTRKINITKINVNGVQDEARIRVEILWKEKNRDRSFVLKEDIFNW
ncbi:MAG TPA: hypothetical protein ENG99_00240 [bacterium]|nr:hypothetical protein [bacterium]